MKQIPGVRRLGAVAAALALTAGIVAAHSDDVETFITSVIPYAAATTAVAAQSEAVRPQETSGGCSCGGAHPAPGMSPSQEEAVAAQKERRRGGGRRGHAGGELS